jgi:hypothetical protein
MQSIGEQCAMARPLSLAGAARLQHVCGCPAPIVHATANQGPTPRGVRLILPVQLTHSAAACTASSTQER